jgi:1-acyl-sn-glycerol-3-phosphate acyltransferase
MKTLSSIFKYIYAAFVVYKAAILCKLNPKNELKYRKDASKKLVSLVAKSVEIIGKIDKDANLLIGNHTHNMDIPLLESATEEKLIWVAKKELGEIPIAKWLLTETEMILIDRNNKASSIKMIKEIKDRVKRKLKVVIFPEGTRNKKDPKKLQPFKKAPKAIAEKLNLKVQPFVIVNLPFAFDGIKIKKVPIKIYFLDSFYPYEGWYEETKRKMQEILDKEYGGKK